MNNREKLLARKKELEEELSRLNQEICSDPEFKEQITEILINLGFVESEECISDSGIVYEMLSEDMSVLCTLDANFEDEVFDFCYSDFDTGIDIKQDLIKVREELLKYLETPISFINYQVTLTEISEEWVLQSEYKYVMQSKDSAEDLEVIKTVTFFKK